MGLDIKITKKEEGTYIIVLNGSIDTETFTDLEEKLKNIFVEGVKAVVMDMAGVDFISSMGLGVIVWARKSARRNKLSLTMINLQPQIQKLFNLMKLAPNIHIHDHPEGDKYIAQIVKDEVEKRKS
jgi:anti-anti-sigma factor